MTEQLVALLDGEEVGRVHKGTHSRLTFVYKESWRQTSGAYPLSLSMPLVASEHRHAVVEAFLWGLLPDNEFVLNRWAQKFQISSRSAFAFLRHVGEDCAGAVQFVPPERLESLSNNNGIEWLDDRNVAERLRALREDQAAWRLPRDEGQFSLAGAQPKTALLFKKGRWGIPSGRVPTTHILKPPTGRFDGHAENEHICLALARSVGLPTARSKVMRFEDETAIVIERYDRVLRENKIIRVHQEDMCQALGVMPMKKYQNEGGPGMADCVELLRMQSSEPETDVATFADAVAFNWLIAGTDAHAKNYSVLIGEGPRVRFAPLYDIASILPYDEFSLHKIKLAMKIGGEYGLNRIGLRQWEKFAREARIDPDRFLTGLRTMAAKLPGAIKNVRDRTQQEGLDHAIIDRLAIRLLEWVETCKRDLKA